MAYEILKDDGYSIEKSLFFAFINLAATVYLLIFVLTYQECLVISGIVFLAFIIQSFTSFRMPKTLGAAVFILLISFNAVICWQLYNYFFSGRDYNLWVSLLAIFGWFISGLALGRHYYGYLKLAEKKTEPE